MPCGIGFFVIRGFGLDLRSFWEVHYQREHRNDADRLVPLAVKIALAVVGLSLLLCGAVFVIAQVKIFVVPPMLGYPDGAVLLVRASGAFNIVDSPDAVCERENGDATLICRAAVVSVIARSAVLAQLPYWETLHRATGAPNDMR